MYLLKDATKIDYSEQELLFVSKICVIVKGLRTQQKKIDITIAIILHCCAKREYFKWMRIN